MKLILFQKKKTTKPINQIKMQRYINVNCTMTYFIVYIYTAVEGNLSISWLSYAPHSLVIDFRYLYVSIASLDIHSFGRKIPRSFDFDNCQLSTSEELSDIHI